MNSMNFQSYPKSHEVKKPLYVLGGLRTSFKPQKLVDFPSYIKAINPSKKSFL